MNIWFAETFCFRRARTEQLSANDYLHSAHGATSIPTPRKCTDVELIVLYS